LIYVVLGMHKSGTTLVSQILHNSGINMGEFDEGISYDKGNKYERQDPLALDMRIMGKTEYTDLDVTPGHALQLTDQQRTQMKEIIESCQEKYSDWGFKDPRAALLYQLWAEELPEHKLIVVFRSPEQVWPRFRWMGKRKYHTNFRRAYDYLLRWYRHNDNILTVLNDPQQEFIVLNYNALMSSDKEFQRLQRFVGTPLVDKRKPSLYRSKSGDDLFIRVARWYLHKRTGKSCANIYKKLDSMRP